MTTDKNPELVTLALKTLGTFDFTGSGNVFILSEVVLMTVQVMSSMSLSAPVHFHTWRTIMLKSVPPPPKLAVRYSSRTLSAIKPAVMPLKLSATF